MKNKTINKQFSPELDCNKSFDKIKRLETALKEKEDQFLESQKIANFGFWEIDPVTQKSTWTDGVYKIVGLENKNEELNYFVLNEIIHPLDRDLFYNAKDEVLTIGENVELDIRMRKTDNSWCYVHIIAKPKKDKTGEILGLRNTVQDISDLKKC